MLYVVRTAFPTSVSGTVLELQAVKHTLHRRIVPTVATTAHALAYTVTSETLAILMAVNCDPDPSGTAAL